MANTNDIRKQLVRIARNPTDKRWEKLADDVLELCDEYDQATSLTNIIKAGESSLDHSFQMIESLRKSL